MYGLYHFSHDMGGSGTCFLFLITRWAGLSSCLYTHIARGKPQLLITQASPQAMKTFKMECGGVLSNNSRTTVYQFCYAVFTKIKSLNLAHSQREGT